ncbi:MAG TPA: amino acid adenylation domain-containing protein [Thermoanaerobaculia bacterium]|jgi:amino acid adenylation domain-containing protein|nr:amino acid adenylation domain-containing protein [Thermoanaerobaculia bacterium]
MDDCLHHLFERQAVLTPDASALSFAGASWTYAELNARASRLAHRLRAAGVVPESLVGLLTERSPAMIAALLGVLKAGGAYVPLDPGYPEERLRFLWEDAGRGAPAGRPRVLLAERHLAGLLPAERAVLLDETEEGSYVHNYASVSPDNLAYVIYTSGSTGQPKGVLVPHRGAVNVARTTQRLFGLGPGDRMIQLASLGFDASVLEIFTTLSCGACLVLTRRETLLSGAALGRELREQRITALAIPPSLLDTVEETDFPDLRSIVLGGEACSAATAARWAAGRRLLNAYAPTEATIYSTVAAVKGDGIEVPSIGQPIDGLSAHLLGPDGETVAAEETGEIFLGGVGVVRGYHNRPELTAERFVPDPFGGPGSRLYRSGDLARLLPSGDLMFAGRADTQVKVRGYRIELGEIEAVLGRIPAVQTAAVLARDDDGTGKRLVAYVVRRPETAEALGVSALREILGRKLPDYMVPAVFVFLESMPTTPTGKIDRRALPAPDRVRPELDSAFVAPRTPLEERLARLWSELLGLDPVGVHDNFFALGGHSLLAGQVVTRLRDDLGLELPLRTVFDHPTVAALADAAAVRSADRLPPIVRRNRSDQGEIPLSSTQERVWFLNQLAPGAIAYNFQFTIRFAGAFAPELMQRTLSELVRRHEILRTTFPEVDGRPVQVVHPPFAVALPLIDLTALPAERRLACAEELVRREIRTGFDIARLPLLRWLLLRLDPRDHLLLQVEHHFVHDGWSLAVFLRELKEIYTAYHAGLPSPLPEPPVQYTDFVAWQRGWMQGEALAAQLAYWKDRLAGYPPPLELPTDRPRPRRLSFRGAMLRVDLPPALYSELRAFSRREGSTLFMSMLAVFYTLLWRSTGQGDILLGSGFANRRLREIESLVGMVVNTLVFRVALAGDLSFRELLARVRATALAAHDHQDLPFEKLVEELHPDRDASRNPLFQVLFSFHDAPVPDLDFAGMTGFLYERHNGSAKTDLNIVVKPMAEQRVGRQPSGGEALTMVWEYSLDLFEAATIDRLWGHYQVLLAAAMANPGARLDELAMLTPAEAAQLASWGGAADGALRGELRAATIDGLFAAQAAATPDAMAVEAAGVPGGWIYRELEERANRLARHLTALGVGPEVRVGVCLNRSPEAVLALLAVLKAGGVYVPLEPAYPRERLGFMIEDAAAPVVVTTSRHLAALGELGGPDLKKVVLDLDREAIDRRSHEAPAARSSADNLAYVVYTSGSTGRPKGVAVPHRAVVRLVKQDRFADLSAGQTWLQLAPVAFDASTLEIWGSLLNGGRLVVFPSYRPSLEELGETISGHPGATGITSLWLTAGLFHQMADAQLERFAGVRQLLAGGDVLSPPHVEKVLARFPELRLVNGYGPTENTTFTCCHVMQGPQHFTGSVPIGRPISGTRVMLLDGGLRRVPQGVTGELYAGGDGLARGYLGRPELTAERFVPDPLAAEPGARLYRTGDLARWLADCTLEFLGRADQQVKIRGFRIEPGEIETVIREQPAVREAAVVARTGGEGGASLAAYVVPAADDFSVDELRAFLAARLPEYMVPSTFTVLEALPLTANGKVDVRALPEPEVRGSALDDEDAVPRSPVEELLAGIWSAVLGVPAVGLHDDFFHLGGHSLIATRMLSRVRDAVQAEVPLAALFEGPTVAGLARAVESALSGAAPSGRIPRRAAGAPIPLSFSQERLWFLDQLAPGGSAYNIARAFDVRGDLDTAALARAVAGIVSRHEALRTVFPDVEGRPVQEIAAAEALEIPVVDLTGEPAERREPEIARLVQSEARRPFDLRSGPLLRLLLVRTGEREQTVVLAMHHIVSDGWSMGLFFRELSQLYGADRSDLPDLPIQYADFAVWQRAHLQGETPNRLLAVWKAALDGAPATLDLPADRPRPPVQAFRGGQEAVPLPADLAAALRGLAQRSAATPFILLLAGLAALFGRYSSQDDIVLGSPIAGRNRSEIEGLIGFFVNTLVLRTRWQGDPAFTEVLAAARRATLMAHAHQELPFEKLVAELAPDRNLAHTPLFQVLFAFQEAVREPLALPGAAVVPREVRRDESRFDLEVTAVEGTAGALTLLWRYDSDLFDRTTVLRLAAHCATLLQGVVDHPAQRLSDLPLLAAAEEREILVAWNDTGTPQVEPVPATLASLFAAQAARTPNAMAVVGAGGADGAELTYAELDRRAEQVARRLRAVGVGPEVPVGVLLEREPDLVAALLGVHKAGGFYVPLDPAYPAARLAFMLEDSGARTVVTRERLLPRIPMAGHAGAVCLDDLGEERQDRSMAAADPDNLAYLIYTSGSTGRPKGVAITHRSAAALVLWARGVFPPADLAGVLAATSVCFDLSVFELFVPLCCGGTVVLAENALQLAGLPALIAAGRVTLLNTVPSAMTELLRLDAVPPSVRTVNLAGEPLTTALVGQIVRGTKAERVFDLYGPSEDTTYSTFALRSAAGPATIGRPIAGTRVYLLDGMGKPVPAGVAGELYLAGGGLARGYLNRPELTAERFVPDPFAGTAGGGRLYRTGDLARWRPDGTLEFLGRIDHQVKIRGFRIELGEIEEQLLRHGGVREVVVVARENRPGEKRLVGYLVGEELQPEALAAWLGERLPAHMVPGAFVILEALPRTPNGKVDRKALPRPEPVHGTSGDGFVAPESAEERSLAAIWSEVLGVEQVGVHDDFFRLGGHSLLAAQVIARLRRDFQVDLPLRSLFQAPSIAGLLGAVRQARESTVPVGVEGLPAVPRIERVARTAAARPRPATKGERP